MHVTLHTTKGDIDLELYPEKAPKTVTNFVHLAETGYYDGIQFHRVIDNFMIQWGDPTGTWAWGPGYTFEDEFHPELRHNSAGILSMANAGPATNWSQFFITHTETERLDDKHTVFGKVVSDTHQEVVNGITQWDTIEKVTVHIETEWLYEDNAEFLEMIKQYVSDES